MEPDVIRMYSSSPPPIEDGADEEDDEFGDFGTFSGVPNSISFTEFDTPTTFNQTQAMTATSPPELNNGRAAAGFCRGAPNGTRGPGGGELPKANGVTPLDGPAPERTEMKKALAVARLARDAHAGQTADCNGGGSEVLTNGFVSSDPLGSPSSQTSVHCHVTQSAVGEADAEPAGGPEDQLGNFAAFSGAESEDPDRDCERESNEDSKQDSNWDFNQDSERDSNQDPNKDSNRDSNRDSTGPSESSWGSGTPGNEDFASHAARAGADSLSCSPVESPRGSCNTDRGSPTDSPLRDAAPPVGGTEDSKPSRLFSEAEDKSRTEDKSSGNETETETETETSFGRPLSTDALEEFGDVSTTGSAPSPPLPADVATPADDSQLAEDDEDFGDFGDAGSFGGADFADFEQPAARTAEGSSAPTEEEAAVSEQDDDFGDFNSPKFHSGAGEAEQKGAFAGFPVSDSFGNFTSAAAGENDQNGADDQGGEGGDAWSAFGCQREQDGEAWAAFSTQEQLRPATPEEREAEEQWRQGERGPTEPPPPVSLSGRLERLFESSFPPDAERPSDDEVATLRSLLEPPEPRPPAGAREEAQEEGRRSPCNRWRRGGVWLQLQDIHEALGLRYQWGGSHCNKALLCCLGIDTRNILFTGQKKQPVIVPMYAAGLGMLEPTKEPVKPVSAAEMIASIGQAPPAAPPPPPPPPPADGSPSASDPAQQEALPPVQFDWSSSGLTNPLDASGGSALLNLDFFGPVEDSGCASSASIPGVDPELYELTTAKMDAGGSGSRVADAFARLMSTMEKTSTSTRRPRREENLSEEALKVMAALPDLTFMQAKVLMFPATLTPLGSSATPD